MRWARRPFTALALALAAGCHAGAPASPEVDPDAALLGGDGTIFDHGDEAFAYPARNMPTERRGPFQIGDGVFNRNWAAVPGPEGNDGRGPTYNAISCSSCHTGDGRGSPPDDASPQFLGLLLRLSVPGTSAHGGPMPDPVYGDQLQPYGVFGVPGEGTPVVTYMEMPGSYGDGKPFSLRAPTYTVVDLSFGPLGAGGLVSPRLAPQTIGLGLLAAVDESTVLGFAAKNGGKANYVWDDHAQKTVLGRFGWKANQPTVDQQVLAASRNDMGITDSLYPTENCMSQAPCLMAPQSMTQPNLEALLEQGLVVHAYGLAVPARRDVGDPTTTHGEALFAEAGCASCHIPKMTTGMLAGWPELSNQTIRPFTDLLVHDMGPGLADGRPDYLASGSEWRTPPLWGLGLVEVIEDSAFFLHDGRARSFEEAILWHGGQAEAAKEKFRTMAEADRNALVAFLSSL